MKNLWRRRTAGLTVVVAVLSMLVLALGGSAPAEAASDNPNDPAYWLALYPNAIACYKHTPGVATAHGRITTDGTQVRLAEFQPDWLGNRWEVLVVKGGSVDIGFGPGNAVYELPLSGVGYGAPANAGGNAPAVSHWIVCKGAGPDTSTTTAPPTTAPPTTAPPTTAPPTTSPPTTTPPTTTPPTTVPPTTVPPTTAPPTTVVISPTSTVPETTSTTVVVAPTTTVPTTSTTVVVAPTTTTPPTTGTLPFTGAGSDQLAIVALLALVAGTGLVTLSGRSEEGHADVG